MTGSNTKEIPALTGLRGYAAAWVVLFHIDYFQTALTSHLSRSDTLIVSKGYLGVDLFFVLSGFVLSLTYGRIMKRPSVAVIEGFVVGRVFRILPLNWAVLALTVLSVPIMRGHWLAPAPHSFANLALSAALVQQWLVYPSTWAPQSWSLSAEWLMYLLFPILIVGVQHLKSASYALGVCTVLFGALAVVALKHGIGLDGVGGMGLVRCFAEFPLGMALCRYAQLQSFTEKEEHTCLGVGLILMLISVIIAKLDVIFIPAACFLILACSTDRRLSRALLANRLVYVLGELSFSLYLIHWLMLDLAQQLASIFAPDDFQILKLCLAGVAPAALAASIVLNRLVERPAQQIGRRLRNALLARRKLLAVREPFAR